MEESKELIYQMQAGENLQLHFPIDDRLDLRNELILARMALIRAVSDEKNILAVTRALTMVMRLVVAQRKIEDLNDWMTEAVGQVLSEMELD